VEEMALASGTPVPPVYVMDDETGINAFAAGTTPQNAVIGVTRGAINTLSRDQLQGVIAHEFSHILNGDMRMNIRLMGWLHGILVIAMIGYVILRTIGTTRTGSHSSSSNKKNDGGLVIVILLGSIALIVIGYVGVFFAQLIKAAVSRQREFLADASAVQFTRNPSGIAGALKKIGGWSDHARIQSVGAEEASHMFFGSALTSNLFATHPPLTERVRRIDPQFDGNFPPVSETRHTQAEIIDPRSLASRRDAGLNCAGQSPTQAPGPSTSRTPKTPTTPKAAAATASHSAAAIASQTGRDFATAHAAAIAGAERLAEEPESMVESIGQPTVEHIQQIHGLVDQLESVLADDLHNPLGAVAVVYALLMAPRESQMRQMQMTTLANMSDQRIMSELNRVQAAVDRLAAEQRLPVACLALPALHQMSPPQVLDFQNTTSALIRMDNRTSLFEFAVQRFIAKRLVARLVGQAVPLISKRPIAQVQAGFTIVLSTLARVGNAGDPGSAFAAGLAALDKVGLPLKSSQLLPAEDLSVPALDRALDELETAAPSGKRTMLAAFTACISADQKVSVQEGELLRVIADALGCPVPPVL
ncbi:MAG: M48 family metallopeptidase, partial [Pirellulaceae bacterium]|nr:M48 family metallopeptidase [Pirellulaceae bacterium]